MTINLKIEALAQKQSQVSKKLPHCSLSPEEQQKRQNQRQILGQRCRVIFERVRPALITDYYNWFIAIEPDSENYVIAPTIEELISKIDEVFADKNLKLTAFQLNEMGVCGLI